MDTSPEEKISCHEGAPFSTIQPIRWEERPKHSTYRHCSYCGSLHPEDMVAILEKGARLELSDFKYGWPHKFYVVGCPGAFDQFKWYNEHLVDLKDEQFVRITKIIEQRTRIQFIREERKLYWKVIPKALT